MNLMDLLKNLLYSRELKLKLRFFLNPKKTPLRITLFASLIDIHYCIHLKGCLFI